MRFGSRLVRPALLLGLVVALFGCDHATKRFAQLHLRGGPAVQLISGVLDLRYAENPGMAFSMLADAPTGVRGPLLIACSLAVLVALVAFWFRLPRRNLAARIGLASILAGGLGNGLDRLVHGRVVDFIHLHRWPVFNVADICITAGALLLAATLFRGEGRAEPKRAA